MAETPKQRQAELRPYQRGDWVLVPETEANEGLGQGSPVWSEVHSRTPHDVTVVDAKGEARTYSHMAVKAWRRGKDGPVTPMQDQV